MKATRTRFIALGGLCAAAALAYLTRNAPGTAESTIRADLDLSMKQSGWLNSIFFWSYALCQIPAAMLLKRIGARRALSLFAVLWSLASALSAAGGLTMMLIGRACMGIAQAGLVPIGVSAMARWFPRSEQGMAAGAFGGFMSVGGIIAAPLTVSLLVPLGWRWTFVAFALPGILWAAWFASWFRNQPSEHASVNEAELTLIGHDAPVATTASNAVPWRQLITSTAMWCICGQQVCRAAGYIFFSTWFATYLQEARHLTIVHSGWLSALPLLGDVTGCIVGGMFTDAVLRWSGRERLARQGISATALLLCAGLIACAWFVADPTLAVLVISAGTFCAAIANPCAGAVVMRVGGTHCATVSAMMNMFGNFGAAAFPIVVPWLLGLTGSWNAVLVGFAALYVLAAAFWSMLRTDRRVC